MHRLVGLVVALLLSSLVVACGDSSDDGDSVDTTPDEDAGPEHPHDDIDGSAPPPVDRDAAVVTPGDPPPGIEGNCAVDSNKVFHLAMNDEAPSLSALSVDRLESRFGLAYIEPSMDCLDAIYLAELHGAPGTVEPETIKLIDHCSTLDDVALAHNESNWLVAAVDNWMGAPDVWVHNVDPLLKESLPSNRITDDPNLTKGKLSLGTWADQGAMVAWVQSALDGSVSQLMVRALDSEGLPVADAVEIDRIDSAGVPASFNSVTVRAVGNANVLVAYHKLESMSGGKSQVLLRTVDRTGTPLRDVWVLSESAPADAGVDVAAGVGDQVAIGSDGVTEIRTERGGAVVWTEQIAQTGLQVWFQAVGPDGQAARLLDNQGMDLGPAPKKRLVNSPLRAIDASVTRMPTGVGFAVAYRALVGGQVTAPRIRVLFLDRTGTQIGDSDIAYTSEWGGRTAIQSSLDGRFTIGWNELDENDQTVTTLIQLPCSG